MSVEEDGFVHKLVISNPVMADMGKYSCDINGVQTDAYLDVEGIKLFKNFQPVFIKSLFPIFFNF